MDVLDLGAEGVEEGAGDGVAGGGAVELEDADVAGRGGRDVGYSEEGAGRFCGVEGSLGQPGEEAEGGETGGHCCGCDDGLGLAGGDGGGSGDEKVKVSSG